MTLRQTGDREQETGEHPALPGQPVSPDPQSAASQARLYRPRLLSGSSAARAAVEQGVDRSGTVQMTLALRYAVRSDVGLLREGNEDSAYAGPHLLAVADGVGGNAAGEVASAATIKTIARLDAEDPGPDLVGALADAVATANLRLQELISSDPAIEGMGTTLTALLWSEGYGALCHVGDSRAYLLRDGQFIQVTHDHTLVQSLVDEGRITEDDAATHPNRSLLLRALDGRTIAETDLTLLETYPADRYLLCSDGLSGVMSEQTLHRVLASVRDLDEVTLRLVELAIEGGGPDNITCIVADVIDARSSRVPPTRQPVFAGAAADGGPG
jgi:PPM family protein phosphatase